MPITQQQPEFRPGQLLQATTKLWLTQKYSDYRVWITLQPNDVFLVLAMELVPVLINPQTGKILKEDWAVHILTSTGIVASRFPTDDRFLVKPVGTP